jgi:hypothetical protein
MLKWTRAFLRYLTSGQNVFVWAADEAKELGRGGISAVHEATGIHRQSVRNGIQELQNTVSVS